MPDLPTEATAFAIANYIDRTVTFHQVYGRRLIYYQNKLNDCEDFHSTLGYKFYAPHTTVFVFVDFLKNIQTTTYIGMNTMT